MAAEGNCRNVLIAMDGSEYSDYAFDCKFHLEFIGRQIMGVGIRYMLPMNTNCRCMLKDCLLFYCAHCYLWY